MWNMYQYHDTILFMYQVSVSWYIFLYGINISIMIQFKSIIPNTGHGSFSMVLSQDCLGRPILRLQSPRGHKMKAWRARWWSYQGQSGWNDQKRKTMATNGVGQSWLFNTRLTNLIIGYKIWPVHPVCAWDTTRPMHRSPVIKTWSLTQSYDTLTCILNWVVDSQYFAFLTT